MPAPPSILALPGGLVIYQRIVSSNYYFAASGFLLFYDAALTLDREVELIWKQKWTAFTLLWVLLRYVPLIGMVFILDGIVNPAPILNPCRDWVPFMGAYTIFYAIMIQSVFTMRIYALYSGARWIVYAFIAFALGEIGYLTWLLSVLVLLQARDPSACRYGEKPIGSRAGATISAPFLLFDVVVFLMTLYRTAAMLRLDGPPSLYTIFLRDGFIFFICVFIGHIVNIFTVLFAPPELSTLNTILSTTLSLILTNHLIFNLKEAARTESRRVDTQDTTIALENADQSMRWIAHDIPELLSNGPEESFAPVEQSEESERGVITQTCSTTTYTSSWRTG